MTKPHDIDIAEVMTDLCEFYYPGARFIAFPGVVEVDSETGELYVTPGQLVDQGER